MQAHGEDGQQADDESVDFVCDRCGGVVAAIVQFAAVDADDDDGGAELEGS